MGAVRRDLGFYLFIAGYSALAALVAASIGQQDKLVPFVYLHRWFDGWPAIAAAAMLWLGLRSLLDRSPAARLRREAQNLFTAEKAAGLLLFFAIAVLHGVYTSTKTMLPHLMPFWSDQGLAQLDALLHGGDPWRRLTFLDGLTPIFVRYYPTTWFALVALFSLAACCLSIMKPVRSQFLWTFLLCWTLLGNVLAGLFLSGGPVFYEKLHGDPRFAGLTRHIEAATAAAGWTTSIPDFLWLSYKSDLSGFGTGIAAFPSMHVSMATLFVLAALRINRWFAAAMAAYFLFILIGSVHLGWHYAVDGYASIVLTAAIWKLMGWALSRQPSAFGAGAAAQPATVPPT